MNAADVVDTVLDWLTPTPPHCSECGGAMANDIPYDDFIVYYQFDEPGRFGQPVEKDRMCVECANAKEFTENTEISETVIEDTH